MSSLFESIAEIQETFNMIVFVVLFGSLAGVITATAREVRKYLCHRNEMELKREMLDRGLKSPEIEKVMRAHTADAPNS